MYSRQLRNAGLGNEQIHTLISDGGIPSDPSENFNFISQYFHKLQLPEMSTVETTFRRIIHLV